MARGVSLARPVADLVPVEPSGGEPRVEQLQLFCAALFVLLRRSASSPGECARRCRQPIINTPLALISAAHGKRQRIDADVIWLQRERCV